MPTTDRILTAEQAAKMIYNVGAPSSAQVDKVKQKIERGVLATGPRGGTTTTTSAVADYLARQSQAAAESNRPAARKLNGVEPRAGYYQELLKDYFLALLLQRTKQRRTQAFTICVLVMQIVIAISPLVVFGMTYRSSITAMIKPPERVAAERWLKSAYDDGGIVAIEPIPDQEAIRLKFWYKQQGTKRVESVRILTLEGVNVVSADMPE